jgi:quercetin dioxygenase-like cupin family protein
MAALTSAMTKAIDIAGSAENGRHAELLVHDGPLRQTVIALKAGVSLGEHNSPPAASIQMIRGSVRVTGEDPVVIEAGHVEALTHHRHAVEALEDCVFLLTTVTSVPGAESHGGPGTITGEMRRLREEDLGDRPVQG